MRSAPDKDSDIVKVLKSGVVCEGELSKENCNWYEIRIDDTVGFVHKSLISTPLNFSSFLQNHSYLMGIVVLIILIIIIMKGKTEFYIGKKVKFTGSYWGVVGKDKISVELRSCTFEDTLIDKILMLQKTKTYTFYGTVMQQKYLSPYIHIEIIE